MLNSINLPESLQKKLIETKKIIVAELLTLTNSKITKLNLNQKVFLYQPKTSECDEKIIETNIFLIGQYNQETPTPFIKTFDHIHFQIDKQNKLINHFTDDTFKILWFTDGRFLKIDKIRENFFNYFNKEEDSSTNKDNQNRKETIEV